MHLVHDHNSIPNLFLSSFGVLPSIIPTPSSFPSHPIVIQHFVRQSFIVMLLLQDIKFQCLHLRILVGATHLSSDYISFYYSFGCIEYRLFSLIRNILSILSLSLYALWNVHIYPITEQRRGAPVR